MKNKEILKNNITFLNLDKLIIKKLNNLDINTIEDLWMCNRNYFKDNNFDNLEIRNIKISLQLLGLDINKKIY